MPSSKSAPDAQEFAVRGELLIALALTEPAAGSDAANMQLRADKVEGGWLLNGQKMWTKNCLPRP